jgi:hypothetical protein
MAGHADEVIQMFQSVCVKGKAIESFVRQDSYIIFRSSLFRFLTGIWNSDNFFVFFITSSKRCFDSNLKVAFHHSLPPLNILR